MARAAPAFHPFHLLAAVALALAGAGAAAQSQSPWQPPLRSAAPPASPPQSTPQPLSTPQPQSTSQPPAIARPLAGSPSSSQEEYKLGPGDVVRITVYNQPDLQTEVEVSEAGTVAMPLVGEVAVAGKTRTEAGNALSERLVKADILKDANVIVRVIEFRSQQVAVLGEVAKPGRYPISRPSSVAELIAVAGGITAKGSSIVTVVQTGPNGEARSRDVNVNEQISAGAAGKALLLRAGDTITVPSAPVFYIYGEVRQPGAYPIAPNMTVMQALSVSGGLTPKGTERSIRLERRAADGTVKTYGIRGTELLKPNDVLRVPESWF